MRKARHSVYNLIRSLSDNEFNGLLKHLKKKKGNSNYVLLARNIRNSKSVSTTPKPDNIAHVLNSQLEERTLSYLIETAPPGFIHKVHQLINKIDILVHKGLYDIANKYVIKGKAYATKAESNLYLKMFVRYEGIILKHVHKKDPVKAINNYIDTIKTTDVLEHASMEGLVFQHAVYTLLDSSHYIRGKEAEKVLYELGNTDFVTKTDTSVYHENDMHKWMGIITYKMLNRELDEAMAMQQLLYNYYHNKREVMLATRPDIYIGIIANSITIAYKAHRDDIAEKYLHELKQYTAPEYPRNALTMVFYLLYKVNIDYRRNKCTTSVAELEAFMQREAKNMRPDATFTASFTLAQINMDQGNYLKAKNMLCDLIEHRDNSNIYNERNGFFKLIYLIAFYEQMRIDKYKDYLHFKTVLSGFKDYIRKKDGFELEMAFARFFNKVKPDLSTDKQLILLLKLKNEIQQVYNENTLFIRHIKSDYDLMIWVDKNIAALTSGKPVTPSYTS